MKTELGKLKKEFEYGLKQANDTLKLDELYQRFFSRKSGELTTIMKNLKDLSQDARVEMGKLANEVKKELEEVYGEKKQEVLLKESAVQLQTEAIDVTQPKLPSEPVGHLHPITQARWKLEDVARSMGFIIEDGPELESDYYVFEAINIPKHHPARDGQDTFYIKGDKERCMRSHVSNMQVRLLKKYGPQVRAAYPGRTFRNEATDATHSHTFYQFEAMIVDTDINIGHLVGVIKELLSGLYGKEMEVRLRPSYFPFVEPGFELDIKYTDRNGTDAWLEMLGCGLMHPSVIEEAGYDSSKYTGLAFGMGLDRLVMLRYGIEDIRHLYSGDMRFLEQF